MSKTSETIAVFTVYEVINALRTKFGSTRVPFLVPMYETFAVVINQEEGTLKVTGVKK